MASDDGAGRRGAAWVDVASDRAPVIAYTVVSESDMSALYRPPTRPRLYMGPRPTRGGGHTGALSRQNHPPSLAKRPQDSN